MNESNKVVVTRREIIKALRTEPLQAGTFCTLGQGDHFHCSIDGEVGDSDCKVCAVGAIFRSKFKPYHLDVEYFDDTVSTAVDIAYVLFDDKEMVYRKLNEKDYLSALSVYFEALVEKKMKNKALGSRAFVKVTPAMRENLVNFVKKNFPPFIVIPEIK